MIAAASSRWYQLGIELLDDDQVTQLRIIKENNDDVAARCSEMLSYWMQTHPNATWYQLVAAMKTPGVELNELAATVEKSYTGKWSIITNYLHIILSTPMTVQKISTGIRVTQSIHFRWCTLHGIVLVFAVVPL